MSQSIIKESKTIGRITINCYDGISYRDYFKREYFSRLPLGTKNVPDEQTNKCRVGLLFEAGDERGKRGERAARRPALSVSSRRTRT